MAALVYEADQAHDFNLMERHLLHEFPLCETFAINSIDPEFRSHMAKSVVTSIDKKEDNTTGERQLLETLSATHVTAFSVVDENARIFGLIVFLKTGSGKALLDEDHKRISVLARHARQVYRRQGLPEQDFVCKKFAGKHSGQYGNRHLRQ